MFRLSSIYVRQVIHILTFIAFNLISMS